jgi:hypothetical protein
MSKNTRLVFFVPVLFAATFFVPFISSCGKNAAASNVGLNTQLQILNLSPDVHPVNLYIDFTNQNFSITYTYPYTSGYFYLKSVDTPIQIRSALTNTINLLSINSVLKSNHKYSLFITGIRSTNTITGIVTADDTTATPPVGFGKIRYVNASVLSPNINVMVNGTLTKAFTNIKYKQITSYILLPAGNYIFQMSPVTSPGTVISTPGLQATPIQDGRLYTLYSYGEYSHTDSSAFGAGVLTNR